MPNAADIGWFKASFGEAIAAAVAGTPFDLDMLTAIACQETGYLWQRLRTRALSTERILALCVGDTIDSRRAFPRSRAELEAALQGERMFAIARAALIDLARYIPDYAGAAAKPDTFCHGFGLFQYDLQFFRSDPDYFLEQRYAQIEATAAKCVGELRAAQRRLGWADRATLNERERCAVAIAYNSGRYDPAKGLKQGFRDADGRYYGENFRDFLRRAARVTEWVPRHRYRVATAGGRLNLRAAPAGDAAVIDRLTPDTRLRATGAPQTGGFVEVERSNSDPRVTGWVAAAYLERLGPGD